MIPEETFGTYKAVEKDSDSEFFNEFELKIFRVKDEIKFILIMTTNGNFGTIGKDWLGKGIYRNDHLALIIETEIDWTYLNEDHEKSIYEREKHESLPIEIYTDQGIAVVYHKSIDNFIELKKVEDSE